MVDVIKSKVGQKNSLIEKSQEGYRRKIEVDRVLDLNKNLIDKYGERGWKLSLRFE